MHGMHRRLQGVYFTSLPSLAAGKGVHALASASGSRGYTNAGTSAKGEGNELHTSVLYKKVNISFLSKQYSASCPTASSSQV